MKTYDYDTITLRARELTVGRILVGERGGLSEVLEVANYTAQVFVETEHARLTFWPLKLVEVVAT